MISISENNNFDCDSCGLPKQRGKHLMIDVGDECLSLCYDCAETLGIMLLDHVREEDE